MRLNVITVKFCSTFEDIIIVLDNLLEGLIFPFFSQKRKRVDDTERIRFFIDIDIEAHILPSKMCFKNVPIGPSVKL